MKKLVLALSITVLGFGFIPQVASAYFCGFDFTCPSCWNNCEIYGCTDPGASNYDPQATVDDGSCQYPIPGCTDPDALNYNSNAEIDDGSCEYVEPESYSISGRKFNDINNNGIDDSEPGLAGWTITITDGNQFSDSTVTDSEGNYSFLDLDPGTYTICEESQAGWVQTYPVQGCYTVELEEQLRYSNSCPLLSKTGATIVEFPGVRLYSDREPSKASSGPVSVSIEVGEYDIRFASFDAHSEHSGQVQNIESWYLILNQGNTSATPDLPDDQDWLVGLLEQDFVVSQEITSITAYHAGYKTPGNANSIEPRCVAFDSKLDYFDFGNHQEEPEALTIKAYKVVCEEESDLPNWTDSGAPSLIDENTASDYVAQSNGACHLEVDWGFQWGYSDVPKMSGDYIGEAPVGTGYAEWKNFDSLTASSGEPAVAQVNDLQSSPRIWVREVLKAGYIPFTNPPKGVAEDNVSAELYCHTDILNYDNYDYITPLELGETYYCVAFNVLEEVEIPGCTDPSALNYDPLATVDDGSCLYDVPGCTDPVALNYDPLATIDDGSCQYPIPGCTDPNALNYDPQATVDDGSCQYPPSETPGCTDPVALNYDPLATIDDGSCQYPIPGCTDPTASNYNPLATIDDGSCIYEVPGCMDPSALNYDPLATVDDGSCQYPIPGCTDPTALNYNPQATVDDGSCEYEQIKYSISGMKFNDQNNNGVNDSEVGLPDWTIELYFQDQLVSSVQTDTQGDYAFLNLEPEAYKVCEVNKPLWTQTYPVGNNGCHIVTLVDQDISDIDFGNYHQNFQIPGCMDPSALNYDPLATVDDGTCIYEIPGCTDPAARNYNPQATVDDGSCRYGGGTVRPKFSINKTVDQSLVDPGDVLTYTIVVECLGSGIARNTVLTDVLPEGFSYQGDIDGRWELGEMQRGDRETVTYEVLVSEETEEGDYLNTAKVQASNSDAYKDTAEVEVSGTIVKGEEFFPELVIEKTANQKTINPGSYVIYEIEVKNVGDAPAVNVLVEDVLPEGFILNDGSSEISWTIPLLKEDESWKDSFSVYVNADVENGNYDNVAVAAAENHEKEVKDTYVLGVGTLPHTAKGISNLNSFWLKAGFDFSKWIQSSFLSQKTRGITEGILSSVISSPRGDFLSIPKIGVEIPIIEGKNEAALEKGAWLLPQTSSPDEMKNTALAAHRYKYRPPHKETFYLLDKVSKGDRLIVQWKGEEYIYIVKSVFVVSPEYVEVLEDTEEPTLTLITCHPLFSDKSRLIVQGELL